MSCLRTFRSTARSRFCSKQAERRTPIRSSAQIQCARGSLVGLAGLANDVSARVEVCKRNSFFPPGTPDASSGTSLPCHQPPLSQYLRGLSWSEVELELALSSGWIPVSGSQELRQLFGKLDPHGTGLLSEVARVLPQTLRVGARWVGLGSSKGLGLFGSCLDI